MNCFRKSIVFGINAVTRRLERDDTSIILLDVGVEPSLLVKHILVMAQLKSVLIILISFLKKVTLETVGYASAAISLNVCSCRVKYVMQSNL